MRQTSFLPDVAPDDARANRQTGEGQRNAKASRAM